MINNNFKKFINYSKEFENRIQIIKNFKKQRYLLENNNQI